jgi:hypothetical protein
MTLLVILTAFFVLLAVLGPIAGADSRDFRGADAARRDKLWSRLP